MSLSGWMLQKVCHRVQDFARKVFVRYRAGQRHRSDQRGKSQDRSRPCRTLVLTGQQPDNQLKIRLDLIRGKRTSPLIAASDFRGQCAEGTTSPWILAVDIAHIIVDQAREGERLPAGFSSFLLALPDSECIADCLRYQLVTRVEVL